MSEVRGADSPVLNAGRNRVVLVWSLILSLMTLLVIGGFMVFWLHSHRKVKSTAVTAQPEKNVRVLSRFDSPTEDEAIALVKRALANREPGMVTSWFHPGGASPAEVVEFIVGSEARDGRIERYDWLSSVDVNGLLMEGVLVVGSRKDPPSERLAFLTPDAEGVWKVDFDAFARSSRPAWRDLLEQRAQHAQVRVFVAKDAYYNGPFLDESRWVCFVMVSPELKALLPEGQELLRGYCKTGSSQAKAMERIFAGDGRTKRATLEIRRTAGADSRQFEITRVLAEDWVLSSTPFDEKFD